MLKYEAVLEGDVPVGLGPLHTQYDGKGNAYTSLFVESAVAKWKLPPWTPEERADLNKVILDKMPVHYNIGHLVIGGSDTKEPYGKYLVAMNKLSKGRHLSVGPSQPESSQLIDITGQKMTMLYESFTEPEPHFAQILKADSITPIEVYPKAENHDPNAVWAADQTSVTRTGNKVEVKMMAIRSRFVPDTHRGAAGRRDHDPRDQRRADHRHDPRPRHRRARHERRDRSGRDQDGAVQGQQAGRLPVLLHELLLGAAPGDAGLSRRQAVADRRPSPCTPCFARRTRFLDRPLSLASRGVVLLGIVALVAGAFLPLWRIQLVAPQYQEGLTLEMYTHKIAGRKRRTGPGRDQHAQPLHRHEADRAGDFAEMTWMPFAIGDLRPALAAGRGHGAHRPSRRSRGAVHLFRRLLAGHVRLSVVELRPPPEPRRADARRAVHSGRDRPSADCQLRADQPPDGRHGVHGTVPGFHPFRDLDVAAGGDVRTLVTFVSALALTLGAALIPLRAADTAARDRGAWLRDRLASATPGETIDVPPGVYTGPFTVSRPVTLVGHGRADLVGDGSTHVMSVRADDVTIEGFEIRGSGL